MLICSRLLVDLTDLSRFFFLFLIGAVFFWVFFLDPPVARCGHCPPSPPRPPSTCSSEDMCRLPVASLLVCFWLVERSQCNSSLQDSMGELHARFAVSLYQTLTQTENNSNLIVSPVSVSLSLGLLQLGARGNTLAQLEETLGYNLNGRIHLSFFPFFSHMQRQSLYSGGINWPSV